MASGGFAVSATILSGGNETIRAGGSDFGAQITGGTQFVSGVASFGTVFSGEQLVQAGGDGVGDHDQRRQRGRMPPAA